MWSHKSNVKHMGWVWARWQCVNWLSLHHCTHTESEATCEETASFVMPSLYFYKPRRKSPHVIYTSISPLTNYPETHWSNQRNLCPLFHPVSNLVHPRNCCKVDAYTPSGPFQVTVSWLMLNALEKSQFNSLVCGSLMLGPIISLLWLSQSQERVERWHKM